MKVSTLLEDAQIFNVICTHFQQLLGSETITRVLQYYKSFSGCILGLLYSKALGGCSPLVRR